MHFPKNKNMCTNPKWIYKKGKYKQDNYRGLEGDFYELGTFSKCGTCEQCMAEKSNNWVIRNYYEQKAHKDKCFITLTYAESPLILVRKDAQNFMKRLRRRLEYHGYENKVRMFGVGEYGELSGRPHLHFILYGWKDEKPKYLGINKKKQIIYQSELIQSVWGKGRTSYQEFNDHEIPYIALYETPAETFKRAYKLNREKLKKLKDYAKNNIRLDKETRKNLYGEIKDLEKIFNNEKIKYTMVKEFNCWSQGLGWEEFIKEYQKTTNYCWKEYIEDCEFVTPSPWVKRLANEGDLNATNEMFRREKDITDKTTDENKEKIKNLLRLSRRKTQDLLEWNDTKDKIEFL